MKNVKLNKRDMRHIKNALGYFALIKRRDGKEKIADEYQELLERLNEIYSGIIEYPKR